MFAEGETELRDLIVQNLDSCGFLNKIKAEIRAGVFLAFEEEGNLRSKIPLFNKKFDEFVESVDGKLIVSVVREFLEYFNLNFTLSVFDPEIATTTPCLNRAELCNMLNLKNAELEGPVIGAILKAKIDSSEKTTTLKDNNSSPITINSHKSLETISEDNSAKGNEYLVSNSFSSLDFTSSKESKQSTSSKQKSTLSDLSNDLVNKKCNKNVSELSKEKGKELKFDNALKSNGGSVNIDHDDFFDDPILTDKESFFNITAANSNDFKVSYDSKLSLEQNTLSSLKDLPSLKPKSNEWTVYKDSPENLKPIKKTEGEKKFDESILDTKEKDGKLFKKDTDPESGTESSEKQLNSEESIEEEIEEDLSTGLDDLLNSSLSLGDDATSDQTISQVSIVDGVDHIEAVTN